MALLYVLQSRPDSFFWPEAVARSLDISLRKLSRDLEELESFGFGFERAPHQGIRYAGPAKRLCVDQIEWNLSTRKIGRRIAVWKRVTSTNDLAARAAKSPSNDGLVILAEEQTSGRGRRHRRWHAPAESSILMSVLVFPPESVRRVALLTSLAAVAVADVIIESLGLPARIKWPNDVRVAGKKVCGVLVEDLAGRSRRRASTIGRSVRATVLGIGINVNIEPIDFPTDLASPATSLMILCGRQLDRSELARSIVQRLDHYYQIALAGESSAMWTRWRERADLIGQRVRIERSRGVLCGRLMDIWPDRGIYLELPSGELIKLPADEVLSIGEL